ncbi:MULTISPECIES: serine/threonine-protein kinase [unclassified Pseudoalteromonas]|uniref:serine/threonine-protein kinase n=1 Tax=unclassified Pseudoalteromonas TaxID=194690 RepID=UPI0005A8D19C|nr:MULTISPECIES: serine/threonine-protein kinase [unclassified Pseudoalteromonas]
MLNINTVAEIEFELREEIGQEGRNSQVFRSYDQALDAELVVKRVPKNNVADADALFNEARTLYKSSHPYVVPINYACQDNDFIYLAMPYFPEGSLAQLMRQRFLTVREIIRFTCQFVSGLHNIHSKGLIHFDIKPDNILLSHRSEALLSDFGLAKHTNSLGLARPNQMYVKQLPPECFAANEYTTAFDVYQVGLTLYRMCVGSEAFNQQFMNYVVAGNLDRPRFQDALRNEAFPNRSAYPEHIPDKIKQTISTCLKPLPDDRFSSVLEITNALSSIDEKLFDWQFELNGNQRRWSKEFNGAIKYIAIENGNSIAKRVPSTGRETNINQYCINNIGVRDLKRFFKI